MLDRRLHQLATNLRRREAEALAASRCANKQGDRRSRDFNAGKAIGIAQARIDLERELGIESGEEAA